MPIPRSNLLPTTLSIDVQRLYSVDVNSQDFKNLLVSIALDINKIMVAVNSKATINYSTNEVATGCTFYPDPALDSTTNRSPSQRQILSKTINFGTLPNNTTKSVAHGIDWTSNFLLIGVRGAATNASKTKGISLGYSSPVAVENISLWADDTNVNVKTGMDRTEFTDTNIFIEFIKG